ncbi:MAG: aconitase/3-isopropylmalate dehydratase large subunit family protein [Pseudomonadota bacterium]|nr:aconitase/3-isopropylmalate dehydratase large subunit family protein [Pseudomonadota bacterium]
MGHTITEKILSAHSGTKDVSPGDIVMADLDLVVDLDIVFGITGGHQTPTRVFDPDKIAVVADHTVPAPSIAAANAMRRMREFVEKFRIEKFYAEGRHGIAHVILGEDGLALPGMTLACDDSHSCSSGALNCLARGLGLADMMYALCKGQAWYMVGPTVKLLLNGELGERVYPRDILHHIAHVHGAFPGRNLEWDGDAIAAMPMQGRFTLATLSAELSTEFSLFRHDDVLKDYLDGRASKAYEPVDADDDATYEETIQIDVSELEPLVILPHKVTHNATPANSLSETKIDQAFIGSCANGRIEDFAVAAEILSGRQVAPGVRMIVTPGSQNVLQEAMAKGYVETLMNAGAVVTNSTCGACYGGHMGVLGDGEVCITASTRNFQGRMGSPEADIYLGSPATVAASAIRGVITDPREV